MIKSHAGGIDHPGSAAGGIGAGGRAAMEHIPMTQHRAGGQLDILYAGFVLGHGGDAIQMVELAAEIGRRGLQTRILVPELPTTLVVEERARSLGLDLVRTPWIRADATSSRQNLIHLLRAFRDNRASLYHLHTGDVCLPRLALLAIGLLDLKPVVVTTHSPYATMALRSARARHWSHASRHQLDRIICPSDHSRRLQVDYGVPPEKVMTIRNSVDLEHYAGGDAGAAYESLGIDRGRRLILFTSRLDAQKRPRDAIRSFACIAGDFPDTDLVLAGCGAEESRLRELAAAERLSDRVHFPGFQKNVPDWLAAASAWIFPTESENFSLSLLEALAAGCPIVSTECQGNDEVLVNERNALTCQVGDVSAMADGLRRILSDSALARRLSAEARETVSTYSVSHMVDRYARCYNECLGYASPQ